MYGYLNTYKVLQKHMLTLNCSIDGLSITLRFHHACDADEVVADLLFYGDHRGPRVWRGTAGPIGQLPLGTAAAEALKLAIDAIKRDALIPLDPGAAINRGCEVPV